jgi:hypothetical protein
MGPAGAAGPGGARDWFSNLFKRDPSKSGIADPGVGVALGVHPQAGTAHGNQTLSGTPRGSRNDSSEDISGTYYRYNRRGMHAGLQGAVFMLHTMRHRLIPRDCLGM